MEQSFITPNIHVILVHFPIAMLVSGTLIELFSFMWRRHGFRWAGRWMILLGALLSVPTAFAGIYALHDAALMGIDSSYHEAPWKEVAEASRLTSTQWSMLYQHTLFSSIATVIVALVAVTWMGCSDRWRRKLHFVLLLAQVIGVALVLRTAWFGGETVYRQGTGVVAFAGSSHSGDKSTTAPSATTNAIGDQSTPAADTSLNSKIEYYAPPLQLHMVLAGLTVSVALAAIGLSIRKLTQSQPQTQVDFIAAALGPPPTLLGNEGDVSITGFMPDPQDAQIIGVPASRFWLLATLCGLLAALAGDWYFANDAGTWVIRDLWNVIKESPRLLTHFINGGAIIVLPIVLAMLARWAPRKKWMLTIFVFLLIVAVGVQVWLGVLLMYDTSGGPLMRFN